jgi:hypothetical protein
MTLLEPHITQVGQPEGSGTDDRLADWVAAGTPSERRDALTALVGEEQVNARASDLVRYATDASPYRLVPQVVPPPRRCGRGRASQVLPRVGPARDVPRSRNQLERPVPERRCADRRPPALVWQVARG